MGRRRGVVENPTPRDALYAIAGTVDVQVFQTTVERYDPAADRWHTVAALSTGRGNLGAAAAGFEAATASSRVEALRI